MKIIVDERVLVVGNESTLAELLKNNGVKIKNNCEGNCACGRCLVELEKHVYNILPVENDELDLLEKQLEATKYSRLACQVKINDLERLNIDKIVVKVIKSH
jgi:ferredoxin